MRDAQLSVLPRLDGSVHRDFRRGHRILDDEYIPPLASAGVTVAPDLNEQADAPSR
jgi:hypothetical protein